ncbi:MAG TPA: GNAT family N-acetyltransferase [Acidimicrobiia bacterium]|nr:GNAT family N-acetyltransferase [Acidimicrobiia bacterium]
MAKIRIIDSSDWELLRDVRLEALADAPYAFTSSFEKENAFAQKEWRERLTTSTWFLAFENRKPVGMVACAQGKYTMPDEYLIYSMWTHKDFRRTGVGAQLIDAVKQWTKAQGAVQLKLWVTLENNSAQRFYKKAGFTVTNEQATIPNTTHVCQERVCPL